MPRLLVGFGNGLGFQRLGWQPGLFTSALAAQLTGTLPFGLLTMFAIIGRFDRAYEKAASDLGANPWQRFRRDVADAVRDRDGDDGVVLSSYRRHTVGDRADAAQPAGSDGAAIDATDRIPARQCRVVPLA